MGGRALAFGCAISSSTSRTSSRNRAIISPGSSEDFTQAFEAAFARLQVAVEHASRQKREWPAKAAAAVAATIEFAASDPAAAQLLTNEALARGAEGISRHERVIAYAADQLATGRALRPENAQLPEITERALVGGLVMLVAQRLDQNRLDELPASTAEMIEFVLTPYVGADEARRVASDGN
jgi:predicted protein tyrosine phosphatase